MPHSPPAERVRELTDLLRRITHEAAAARSALCENELVIRLDNILALAGEALEGEEGEGTGRTP
ncbi:hypothetical protein [Azospirillum sp. SYSU D00513]|uniref:hypothetical protein n=1 Tax=Azospirillum sp. SYSU D00513 TaxID=2812561 RepID=UPI001A9633B8|nr:hypothetical protein [Azospirillum sp. SYSU D00513]